MPRIAAPLALASMALAFSWPSDPGPARAADGPGRTSWVLTAGDIPEMARGFTVDRDGEYTVKAWTPARMGWSLEARGRSITLTPKPEAGDARPRWQSLGKVQLSAGPDATLAVAPTPGTSGDPAPPPPVPAILSISSDPDFVPTAALDLIRGRVDSVEPTADRRRAEVRTNYQGADFRPPASPGEWRDRSRAVREQLLVTLGLWPMLPKTDLNPRVVGTLERDGYTIDRVVLQTLPGFSLAGNLYRPTKRPGRLPMVLCPHGHSPEGRVNGDVQSRCVRLAQLGCVVFLYDMVGYADGKPFGHAFLDDRLRRWGLSLATLQTWNSIRALDWVASRPDVDPARVAVTGESGGATQTLFLTAIDDRVKVSAPVVMVSDGFQGGCVCENAAGLRLGTDNVEIAALAAPRPMKLVGATGDWTARTMTNAYPTIQMVYGLVGTTDRVGADVFDFPHNYNRTSRDAVYAFLGKWFLGVADPASTREGEIRVEKPEDLFAFGPKDPYPADAKTPAQLEAELVGVLGRQVDKLAPGVVAADWEASRSVLATALRVRVGVEAPAPRDLDAREVRKLDRDGLAVAHHVVGRKGRGDRIPVVRLTPARPNGRLTVLFTRRGKADLVTPEGRPAPLVKALLDRGHSIVGFDPLLVGESVDPSAPAARRPSTVHFETYNPSLAADRAQDLATVLAWAGSLPDVRELNLVAPGAAGPLALLARPALRGLARTAVDLSGFDPGDGSGEIPPGLDLPGALQFGGLKVAAALTAPAPLFVYNAGKSFEVDWPIKSYALADALPQLYIQRLEVDPEVIARWIDAGEAPEFAR